MSVGERRHSYLLWMIAVMLLAVALRIYLLEADAPLDLSPSEELNLDGPVTIAAGRDRALYGSWSPFPGPLNSYRYYPAMNWAAYIVFSLLGTGYWQARLISVFAGVLSIALMASFARGQFGQRTSRFTALFMASSYIYVIFNRDPMAYTVATCGISLSLYWWGKGVRRSGWFALAGAAMAFNTLFIKLPGIVILPAAMVGFGLLLWRAPKPVRVRDLGPTLLFAAGAAIVGIAWLFLIYLPESQEVSRAYYFRTFSSTYTLEENIRFAITSLLLFGVDFGLTLRLLPIFVLSYGYAFYRASVLLSRDVRPIDLGEAVALTLLVFSVFMLLSSGIRPMRFFIMLIPVMSLVAALAIDRWLDHSRLRLPSRFGRLFPLFLQIFLAYFLYQILAAFVMLNRIIRIGAGPNDPGVFLEVDTLYSLLVAALLLASIGIMSFLVKTVRNGNYTVELPSFRKRWAIATVLIGVIVGSDLGQYWTWAKRPEYSLVEASRAVGSLLDPETSVLGGTYAYTLALENELPAVWFFNGTPPEERMAAGVTHFVRSYSQLEKDSSQPSQEDGPCVETLILRGQMVKLCEVK